MTTDEQPDWMPRVAAFTQPEGTRAYGSTGQLWEVKDRQWVRIRDPQVTDLVAAMDQLLDDMGKDRQCVCAFAKAKARIAFEPFRDPIAHSDDIMSLDDAKRIVAEVERT